jgi:hypothetical protein
LEEEVNGKKNRGRRRKKRSAWMLLPPVGKKKDGRQREETEDKGKRDFPRTYAQFQKTAGTYL